MFGKLFTLTIVLFSFVFKIGGQMLATADSAPIVTKPYATCTQPSTDAELCAAQEAEILASVVRIVFHGNFQKGQHSDFRGSVGHATVMNGRYLLTHNHFSIDLVALSLTNHQGVTGFSLYNAAGQTVVRNAPAGTFQVSAQENQVLVLDFGQSYFDELGLASASFLLAENSNFAVGAEVAQLDWDGERAYVIWTTVTQMATQHSSPFLALDNFVMPGASGGGVFWHGYHVANNWADVTVTDPDSGVLQQAYSLAALNSQNLLMSQ